MPLFQRPYVWNQESQWEPLWTDVVRVAERLIQRPHERHQPHFLGAVVLQQAQNPVGLMQTRTIIDGQQRLTTLQLLIDALHAELLAVDAGPPAARLEPLVMNAEPFRSKPEDRFKVWPTNRDRPAFNAVMSAEPPVDYDSLSQSGERIVEAHRFFSEQARDWLRLQGPAAIPVRAMTIETVVRELLQLVVIDLTSEENAQEIFETLNARGAQLTAADLIKNFVFQRLSEAGTDVDGAYQAHWKDFETGFWETEISVGRIRYPRSSLFLNHWLISRTGDDVVAREVFDRYKRYADHESNLAMTEILSQVHRASAVYRNFVLGASATGPVDRLGLFGYRAGVLESEVIKPLILCLLDPEEAAIPELQFIKALEVMASWMVRRMLVRATTKNYNKVFSELVRLLRSSHRQTAGDSIEKYLAEQSGPSRYWPDDEEVRKELDTLMAYRRLRRARLRMLLEAIEDHLRGWKSFRAGLGGERVARGNYAIEHVMPREWVENWPLPPGISHAERDGVIDTLGNLTLLTGKLNSKVSNAHWLGDEGKRQGLEAHDVLILNREIVKKATHEWTEDAIRQRTHALTEQVIAIWPVPEGHRSGFSPESPKRTRRVLLSDLMNASALHSGMSLFPRSKKHQNRVATLLADGCVEVDGQSFASPSDAARHIRGRATNGWWFFLVNQTTRRSLKDVRSDYVSSMAIDNDEMGGEDDTETEEEGE